jgi:hypothetical protein
LKESGEALSKLSRLRSNEFRKGFAAFFLIDYFWGGGSDFPQLRVGDDFCLLDWFVNGFGRVGNFVLEADFSTCTIGNGNRWFVHN